MRASRYIVAVDQGTTSTRALVLDGSGHVVGASRGSLTIPALCPRPGWVEFEPGRLIDTVRQAIASAILDAKLTAADITAVGMANQGETVIAFDRITGEPLCNAISWQDRRSEDIAAAWRAAGMEEVVARTTGLRIDTYFSAAKLRWIMDEVPAARQALAHGRLALGTSDAWLLWQLSGGRAHVTDVATASRTMLLDLARGAWDERLCDALGVPIAALPAIVPNAGPAATLDTGVIGREVPITGLCVDQHAALFGHGCRREHSAKATYGTGCFFLAGAGERADVRAAGLLTALAWRLDGRTQYLTEGGVFSAGSVVEWLIELGMVERAADIDAMVSPLRDSRGVVLIPAFTGLGAPHWAGDARACFAGMDAGTRREHLVRAALEGIAFRVRDICDAMSAAGVPLERLRVDGGLTRSRVLMQMQADAIGCAVEVADSPEVTALGVGLMAGLGAGMFAGVDALPEVAPVGARFEPRADRARVEDDYRRWRAICESVARFPPYGE